MDPLEFVVKAGPHARHACPVWVQLPVPPDPRPTLAIFDDGGTEVPCQAEVVGTGTEERLALTFIVRDLPAGAERVYRLVPGPPAVAIAAPDDGSEVHQDLGPPSAAVDETTEATGLPEAADPLPADIDEPEDVRLRQIEAPSHADEAPTLGLLVGPNDGNLVGGPPSVRAPREKVPGVALEELPDGRLGVEIDGVPFTTYHFGSDVTRPYFHPLIGPTGRSVVRDYPMVEGIEGETSDHPHHRGMWTAHGDVNGHDNWLEGSGKGSIRHTGFPRLVSGVVYGSFDANAEWIDRWGSVALTDTRRVTIFNLGPDERLIEYAIRVSASQGQVSFGDTKEAGIVSVRVASSMDGPTRNRPGGTGRIETSDGSIGEGETWGRRAAWCDYSGPVDGEIVGVAILDHPTNPRFPTHWHVRDYGLMTVNPFGLHDFTGDTNAHLGDLIVPPYESRVFRYRILLHRGDATAGSVLLRYHDFANPPVVELR